MRTVGRLHCYKGYKGYKSYIGSKTRPHRLALIQGLHVTDVTMQLCNGFSRGDFPVRDHRPGSDLGKTAVAIVVVKQIGHRGRVAQSHPSGMLMGSVFSLLFPFLFEFSFPSSGNG